MSTPTPLQTRPATTKPITEEVLETGEPAMAHIVKTEPGEDAASKVLEARIYGTPLEAYAVMYGFRLAIRSNFHCAINAKTSTRPTVCLMTD